MTDIHTDMPVRRTRHRAANGDLPTWPSKRASDLPEGEEYATLPSAGAKAPTCVLDQGPSTAAEPPRIPWKWVPAALFSLTTLLLIAGAYWYLTGPLVRSVDDPFAEVGSISADVLGTGKHVEVAKNQPVRTGQIVYRLDPSRFQVAFDNAKTRLAD